MTIVVIHAVSLAFLLVAAIWACLRLRRWLARDVGVLLAVVLIISSLHDLSNILEWSRLDLRPDFAEDFLEVMLPLMWIFLFYGLLQHMARVDLENEIEGRKRAEQKRSRLQASMLQAQKLESLGVLSSGIAHDFNNILTTILGNAELLSLKEAPDTPPSKETQAITSAAQQAADLCRQMLAYSGKAEPHKQGVDINDLLKELQPLLRASLSKKARIVYDLSEDLPTLQVDPSQMRQVFMNLLINASEALGKTPGQVHITSSLDRENRDRQDPRLNWVGDPPREQPVIRIEVKDSGQGMDPATQQRIFDPFFTTKFTGRGLGLAAVLGIIHGHEGQLGVASELGAGSRFVVLLPVTTSAPQGANQAKDAQETTRWQGSGTVLIVEDEAPVRVVLGAMLVHLGFEVLQAATGREGLERVKRQSAKIRCMVLDWDMPTMGGEEVLQEMQALELKLPVLISSGLGQGNIRQYAGPLAEVQKPYRLEQLRTKLHRLLEAAE